MEGSRFEGSEARQTREENESSSSGNFGLGSPIPQSDGETLLQEHYGNVLHGPEPADSSMVHTPETALDFSHLWGTIPWVRFQEEFQALESIPRVSPIIELGPSLAELQSGAALPPLSLCNTGIERGETISQLHPIVHAVYIMSNQPSEIWYGVIKKLDAQSRSVLFEVLVGMRTTSTRVLVERICRHAVKYSHIELLQYLDATVILETWKADSGYPVFTALLARQRKLALRLIEAGANLTRFWGPKILVTAIEQGYHDMVPLLIQRGVDIKGSAEFDQQTTTPLMVAIARHKSRSVTELIKLGADVNCTVHVNRGFIRGHLTTIMCDETALGLALMRGQSDIARLLLTSGARLSGIEIANPTLLLPPSRRTGHMSSSICLMIEAGIDLQAVFVPETCHTPLQGAIRCGQIETVKLLLDNGANVNSPANVMGCLLTSALEVCDSEAIRLLIRSGAIVNPPLIQSSIDGIRSYDTALLEAIKKGDIEITKLLLDNGADLGTARNADQNGHQSALYTAVCLGDLPMAKLLVGAGAAVDELNEELVEGRGWLRQTALHAAVRNKNVLLVRELLQAGAEIETMATCSGSQGEYVLSTYEIAASKPSRGVLNLLLSAGSTRTSDADAYILHAAIKVGDLDTVDTLVKAGVNMNATVPRCPTRTPLQEAVRHGYQSVVHTLLNAGALVNAPTNGIDRTALQEAVSIGDISLTRSLIAAGADVDAPAAGCDRMTALQHAVSHNSIELLEIILHAGADVKEDHTAKPLRLAAQDGFVDMVDLLLRFDAAVDPKNQSTPNDLTPLQAAAESGHHEIVARLLSAGAEMNAGAADKRGTALQIAARRGHILVVKLLLQKGVNINASSETADFGTALHCAVIGGHNAVAEILLHHNADPNIPGAVLRHPNENYALGTPLQSAIDSNEKELVRRLVEAGARADVITADEPDRRTPLEAAMQRNCNDSLRLVLRAGANVRLRGDFPLGGSFPSNYRCYGPALVAAVSRGNLDQTRDLLDAGADIDAHAEVFNWADQSEGHLNPLQAAVANSNHELAHVLLDAGADARIVACFPYYTGKSGSDACYGSLLAVAIRNNLSHTGIVSRLIRRGAPVNVPASGNFGRTSLQAAVERGDVELVKELLQCGAEVNAAPSERAGATALQLAAIHGYAAIVSILLDAGADVFSDGAVSDGRTALEGAAEHGRTDLVQLFLNFGIVMNLPRCKYAKALELALLGFESVIAEVIKAVVADAKACACLDLCAGSQILRKMLQRESLYLPVRA
ncbi:ankyrin repeat-containing domain protein [Boeremia exigua]|uniref:ankyrin repeat-containing domain protein n=1 Tax=Boeremia exigua TaxID=749465 RepID=UPI001E8EE89E|nr:ankyrin repeat-containing domain protein [Boeremia exigua]KAH6614053.1 ankyrin repeat-containing domain protein [Boeremia exigua]